MKESLIMRLKQNPERSGDSLHQAAAAPSYYCPLLAEAPSCTPHLLSRRRRGANMEDRRPRGRRVRAPIKSSWCLVGGASALKEGGASTARPLTQGVHARLSWNRSELRGPAGSWGAGLLGHGGPRLHPWRA